MVTKPNNSERQKVAEAAQRLSRLIPSDEGWTQRHIMILVNVASRAEELRVEGKQTKGISEGALEFGRHIAFEDREARRLDLPQKTENAARLFMDNRQLAMEVCESFIRLRTDTRKLRRLGDEQDYKAAYRDALQEILKAIAEPVDQNAPTADLA